MGENTAISWAKHSWNPWIGCEAVSPGCDHCYARTLEERWGRDFSKLRRTSATTWALPARWERQAVKSGEPVHVFTASMSDFFHNDADAWRAEAWDIIKATPHLTYQILTKRHGRIARCLPADWGDGYANVWLGVSVENQEWAQRRIPVLLDVPAAVHFLSCEPLLGPLDLRLWLRSHVETEFPISAFGEALIHSVPGLGWIIAGGESGPGFRPAATEWFRSLRDQCARAGVPFFFKQSSALRNEQGRELDGVRYEQMPEVK